jgi:3-dehydrosphinganine reductase
VVNLARAYLTNRNEKNDPDSGTLQNSNPRHFLAVSSIAGMVPFIGYASYAPTKAAVVSFCDVLRNEFADVSNIHIHCCFPPDMDTPGFAKENETKPIECKLEVA